MAGPDPSPPTVSLANSKLVAGAPVAGNFSRGESGEEDTTQHHSGIPFATSLNLLSDSWNFQPDRLLHFLTENTNFTVIGVIGGPGVGKSTLMNELYAFDSSSSVEKLPPFDIQSEEEKATGRHCSKGIEPRISAEHVILLDTQPVFSASELPQKIMDFQLAVFLARTCHILLGVSEKDRDDKLWHLMSTADMLKRDISDPSLLSSSSGIEKDSKVPERGFMSTHVYVQTKVRDQELTPENILLRKMDSKSLTLFTVPFKEKKEKPRAESYISAQRKIRDQILSVKRSSFMRPMSEREWLKSSAKIWDQVRNSSEIPEYCRSLQHSEMY